MRGLMKTFFLLFLLPAIVVVLAGGCGKKGPPLPPLPEGPAPVEKPEKGSGIDGQGRLAALQAKTQPPLVKR